jgi:deoxycytidylate deaminase
MNEGDILKRVTEEAKKALCQKARCGSLLVSKDGVIIGKGYNAPPQDNPHYARCSCDKSSYHIKVVDKTCCMHAEQRALLDALKNNSSLLAGSTLYYIRLDCEGNPQTSGKPHCTVCSKLALDLGVEFFALYHSLEKPTLYKTDEYNTLSFSYSDM